MHVAKRNNVPKIAVSCNIYMCTISSGLEARCVLAKASLLPCLFLPEVNPTGVTCRENSGFWITINVWDCIFCHRHFGCSPVLSRVLSTTTEWKTTNIVPQWANCSKTNMFPVDLSFECAFILRNAQRLWQNVSLRYGGWILLCMADKMAEKWEKY